MRQIVLIVAWSISSPRAILPRDIVVRIVTPSISPLGLILLCSAAAPLLLDLLHAHMLPLALLMQTELLIVAGSASALAPPFLRRLCRLRELLLSPLASRTGE
jgi:uncharacterized membrane protein